MKHKDFETYIKQISDLLKDNPKEGDSDYNTGYLMAYYQVISTMKNQAVVFDLEQENLSLSDIEPDRDLV